LSGYEVREANGPGAARRILESEAAIDLLVVDYAMPEMTGAALIREARRRRPGLKALLISGHAEAARHVGDAAHGEMDGLRLLRKPFGPAVLAERVKELLDAESHPRPAS
jgi:CheY-like chemotaxis protein